MAGDGTDAERLGLVMDVLEGRFGVAEAAERRGVSRKTAYKYLDRYLEEGVSGLRERSRKPLSCPHATPEKVRELVIAEKRRRPNWGPKKLVDELRKRHPPSTRGDDVRLALTERFNETACQRSFAIVARLSWAVELKAFRSWRFGGSNWAFGSSVMILATRNRTVPTSACIAPLKQRQRVRRSLICRVNRARSTRVVSEAFCGEWVGIEEIDDGLWQIYFGPLLLGRFSPTDRSLCERRVQEDTAHRHSEG